MIETYPKIMQETSTNNKNIKNLRDKDAVVLKSSKFN